MANQKLENPDVIRFRVEKSKKEELNKRLNEANMSKTNFFVKAMKYVEVILKMDD